ncbi:MAG: hypothetical protein P1V81_05300, partial [Planctomycetota bacterium]|nr:hypothetical protein [Planctomycetota bacterium]
AGDEIQTSTCISERYGMHLDAGDVDGDGFGEVFVGANRDDVGGVCEAGRGSLFSGALAAPSIGGPHPAASFTRPAPKQEDLAAYRVLLADLVGGPGLDPLIFSLSALRPHRILVWDGDRALAFGPAAPDAGSPDLAVTALGGHGGHFCGGLFAGDLDQVGRDELVLGDYDFGPAGMPALVRTGRVVVTFWP